MKTETKMRRKHNKQLCYAVALLFCRTEIGFEVKIKLKKKRNIRLKRIVCGKQAFIGWRIPFENETGEREAVFLLKENVI